MPPFSPWNELSTIYEQAATTCLKNSLPPMLFVDSNPFSSRRVADPKLPLLLPLSTTYEDTKNYHRSQPLLSRPRLPLSTLTPPRWFVFQMLPSITSRLSFLLQTRLLPSLGPTPPFLLLRLLLHVTCPLYSLPSTLALAAAPPMVLIFASAPCESQGLHG